MQPNNNPANFIGGLPDSSFGGQPQPGPAPLQQQPAPPADFSQYAQPAPSDPGVFGPQGPQPGLFGSEPQPQPAQQPWTPPANPQPPVQPQQQPAYQQPAPYQQPGQVPPVPQPAPYAPPMYTPPAPAAPQSDEPPAWATELSEMLKKTTEGQQNTESWKPQSWNDVIEKSREAAKEVLTQEQQEKANQEAAQEAQVNQIMQEIDQQINALTYYGQMPAITNPNDPNDQGRSYRRELLGLANVTGSTNIYQLNQNLIAAHKAGMIFNTDQNQFTPAGPNGGQAPGANIPIASGSSSGSYAPTGDNLPPIKQLRSASMGELMSGLTSDTSQYFG